MPNNMERFTQRARRVLTIAQEHAERLEHNAIDTQHMLMALLQEEGGVAGRVLRDLGIERDRLEPLVIELSPVSLGIKKATADLSPATKHMLELAVDEARRMGHHFIGTEHLLLGLVRQTEGVAIEALTRLGIIPEEVRRQTRRVLQESPLQTPSPERRGRPARTHIPPPPPPPVHPTNAYSLMQTVIFKVLEMVAAQTLTMTQAAELYSALAPDLKLSIIEQTDLISQLFQMTKLQHYKVRIRVTDPSGAEAPGETRLPLTRLLTEIETFLDIVVNKPDTPLIYTQDGFHLEVRVEKPESNTEPE